MIASAVYIVAFAGFAVSLSIPDMPADKTAPMEGEFEAAVEEAARKQRAVTKGSNGMVRTVHHIGTLKEGSSKELSIDTMDQAEDAELEVVAKSVSCKWMIAVLPPLLLLGFVMFMRNAAEKAKQNDSKDSWFNSFLRMNLVQQALAVAGQEQESTGAEENAELGKSLLSKVEEDEDGGGCCPDSEMTAASPLLQPIQEEEEDEIDESAKRFASLAESLYQEEDEDELEESAKIFASLAESLYQDGMDDADDLQVLPADAELPSKVQPADPDDNSDWSMFQGSADQVQEIKDDDQFL